MKLNFNQKGNLSNDLILEFKEFEKLFGYNEERQNKITNLVALVKTLNSFGCKEMYIVGSFITTKEAPNDLDVCFDITALDDKALNKKHPEFLNKIKLDNIHKWLKIHLIFFTSFDPEILDWFRFDRNHQKRGIIKLFLKEIVDYDKKRKAI